MVTVRDIAKVAGVSASTVSRALSSPERVSPETRALVLHHAESMGYRANIAARGLSTGKMMIVGLLVPDLENPVFAAIAKGAQAKARSLGYSVFITDSDEDIPFEENFVQTMNRRVDGVILCSPRMAEQKIQTLANQIPILLVNRQAQGVSSISVDNQDAMRQAALHLYALGHRKIAFVGGPRDSWSNKERLTGIEKAVSQLPDVELAVFDHIPATSTGGVAIADQVYASEATAIVSHNDLIAHGILSRFAVRGISVPDEVSIVGFDDIPSATLVTPQLTTLRSPLRKLGARAVERMVGIINSPDEPTTAELAPIQLVVRESSMDRRNDMPT